MVEAELRALAVQFREQVVDQRPDVPLALPHRWQAQNEDGQSIEAVVSGLLIR